MMSKAVQYVRNSPYTISLPPCRIMNVVSQDSEPAYSKSGQRQDALIKLQPWVLSYKPLCLEAVLSVTGISKLFHVVQNGEC